MAHAPDGGDPRPDRSMTQFAIVPEWVLFNASPIAVKVYAIIDRHTGKEGTAFPGRERIGKLADVHVSTVKRAVVELEELGAIERYYRYRDDGSQTSNGYRLRRDPPDTTPEGRAHEPPPRVADEPPKNENHREREGEATASPLGVAAEEPPKVVHVDGRNTALDALVEECGIDPDSPRMTHAVAALNGRGRGTKKEPGIRHLFWREAQRWAVEHDELERLADVAAEPERFTLALERGIRRKAALYRQRMPGATLTPTALRDWWLDLEKAGDRAGGMTAEEIERWGTG